MDILIGIIIGAFVPLVLGLLGNYLGWIDLQLRKKTEEVHRPRERYREVLYERKMNAVFGVWERAWQITLKLVEEKKDQEFRHEIIDLNIDLAKYCMKECFFFSHELSDQLQAYLRATDLRFREYDDEKASQTFDDLAAACSSELGITDLVSDMRGFFKRLRDADNNFKSPPREND